MTYTLTEKEAKLEQLHAKVKILNNFASILNLSSRKGRFNYSFEG